MTVPAFPRPAAPACGACSHLLCSSPAFAIMTAATGAITTATDVMIAAVTEKIRTTVHDKSTGVVRRDHRGPGAAIRRPGGCSIRSSHTTKSTLRTGSRSRGELSRAL